MAWGWLGPPAAQGTSVQVVLGNFTVKQPVFGGCVLTMAERQFSLYANVGRVVSLSATALESCSVRPPQLRTAVAATSATARSSRKRGMALVSGDTMVHCDLTTSGFVARIIARSVK